MGFVSAGVFLMLFLYFFCFLLFSVCLFYSGLIVFLFVCLFSKKEREKAQSWMSDVVKIWGDLREDTGIYYVEKIFLSKRNSRISKLEV